MTAGHPRWAETVPDPSSYKARSGRPRQEVVAEQDQAAGGREHRQVHLPDGKVALASVELKFLGGRRIYAYLRYMRDGRTVSRYLGPAPGANRQERLGTAWHIALDSGITQVED